MSAAEQEARRDLEVRRERLAAWGREHGVDVEMFAGRWTPALDEEMARGYEGTPTVLLRRAVAKEQVCARVELRAQELGVAIKAVAMGGPRWTPTPSSSAPTKTTPATSAGALRPAVAGVDEVTARAEQLLLARRRA